MTAAHRLVLLGITLALGITLPVLPAAQPRKGIDRVGAEMPAADLDKFKDVRNTIFRDLQTGKIQPDAKNKEAIEMAARYFVYRITLEPEQADPKRLLAVQRDLDSAILQSRADKTNAKFAAQFARELIQCFDTVLQRDLAADRMTVVNAAMMLPSLVKLSDDAVGDFLATLVKDASNDVVRLYAAKALQDYFLETKIWKRVYDKALTPNDVRQPEIKRIEPVIEYLTGQPQLKGTAPEELAALQFVRREVIKALAETRVVAIEVLPPLNAKPGTPGQLRAPVAHALLRVLADGPAGLTPPASLREKLEAAIGLCQIPHRQLLPADRYNVDLTACLVSKLLPELLVAYQKDVNVFKASKVYIQPMQPWKSHSERLKQALKDFETAMPVTETTKKFKTVVQLATPLLQDMRFHRSAGSLDLLRATISGLAAPAPVVYQGMEDWKIELRQWPPF